MIKICDMEMKCLNNRERETDNSMVVEDLPIDMLFTVSDFFKISQMINRSIRSILRFCQNIYKFCFCLQQCYLLENQAISNSLVSEGCAYSSQYIQLFIFCFVCILFLPSLKESVNILSKVLSEYNRLSFYVNIQQLR